MTSNHNASLDAQPTTSMPPLAAAVSTHHRICPLCEACCGLEIKVQGGEVLSIRGHEADVLSRGYICPKATALKDLHLDPDRVRTPLIKRNGVFEPATWEEAFAEIERRWRPIRAAFGAQATAVTVGNPAAHRAGLFLYFPRLARALGTRNVFSASSLDQVPKQLASAMMFGHWLSVAVPDIDRTDLLVVLGANPAASNGSMWTVPDFRGRAKALKSRGGRMVVIDPRRSETAKLADEHHFIRPGGDVFLLLGMAHTLFAEGLVKLEHAEGETGTRLAGRVGALLNGLDEVQAAVKPYAPELMAAHCGLSAAAIRQLARDLARTPRAALYGRIGTCTQRFGTLCSWLIDVINALTGHLDEVGGVMFPKAPAFAANTLGAPGRGRGVATGRHSSRVSAAPEVMGELPMTALSEEIETAGEGQIRALFTVASNPVLSAPNGERLARALQGLDFMVSLDIYINETTRHADVILPALSALEESHYDVTFAQLSARNQARYSEAVLPKAVGQWSEWEVLTRLSALVASLPETDPAKLDAQWFEDEVRRSAGKEAPELAEALLNAGAHLNGLERRIDYALRTGAYGDGTAWALNLDRLKAAQASGGIDLGELQARLPEALRTECGKVELAPAAFVQDLARVDAELARAGTSSAQDGANASTNKATTAKSAAGPASLAPHQLILIGRRDVRSNNSWMHNLPTLAKGPFRCTALLHPSDAERIGLSNGGHAWLKSSSARQIKVEIELSPDMMPGVLSLPHGWGHDQAGSQLRVAAQRPGVNMNVLLGDQERDPLSGNAILSGVPIEVSPA
jgi:anaerobic selenocysteine-containing dehydrogenase